MSTPKTPRKRIPLTPKKGLAKFEREFTSITKRRGLGAELTYPSPVLTMLRIAYVRGARELFEAILLMPENEGDPATPMTDRWVARVERDFEELHATFKRERDRLTGEDVAKALGKVVH